MSSTVKLRFIDNPRSLFFPTVKQRVDEYFTTHQMSKNANLAMWLKITFFLGGLISLYLLILLGNFSVLQMWGLAALLGCFAAFNGFNVAHDAIHGSLSSNSKINEVFSLVFNLLGANAYVWSVTHNIVHHTYTNIPGHDEDIEVAPGLVRLSPLDEWKPIHKYQHLYAFLLYGLASLSWVLRKDYIKFFKPNIGHYDNTRKPAKEVYILFGFKALYYFLFIVLPLILLPITWWQFLIGFLTMHLAEGLVLGLVFQLAHVVEGTDFPMPDEKGNIENAWAVHQMRTTANFACDNPIVNFFCGGLNMQVEHHLFPKICHIHYPAISKIVKETAKEFNVPYHENPTFTSATLSHYRMLKRFGSGEELSF